MALTYFNQATGPKVPQPQVATSGVPKNNTNTLYMQASAQPAVAVPKLPSTTKAVTPATVSSSTATPVMNQINSLINTPPPARLPEQANMDAVYAAAGMNPAQIAAARAGVPYQAPQAQTGTTATQGTQTQQTTTPTQPAQTTQPTGYNEQITRAVTNWNAVPDAAARAIMQMTGDSTAISQNSDGTWNFQESAKTKALNRANGVTTPEQTALDTGNAMVAEGNLMNNQLFQQNTQQLQRANDFFNKVQSGQTPVPLTPSQQSQLASVRAQQEQLRNIMTDSVNRYTQAAGAQTSISGTDQYAPQIALGYLSNIQNEGMLKVQTADLRAQEAIASLENAFNSENVDNLKAAWQQVDDALKFRRDSINTMVNKGAEIVQRIEQQQQKKQTDDLSKRIDMYKILGEAQAPKQVYDQIASLPIEEAYAAVAPYMAQSLDNEYKLAQIQSQYSGVDLNKARIATEKAQQAKYYSDANKTLNEMQSGLVSSSIPKAFGALPSLVGGTGGTNAQRSAITADISQALANKDYDTAYTLIAQGATRALKGEASTRFSEQTNSVGVIKDLLTAMNEYERAGGNTNIFKGTADKIQSKIGALMTDPKYASLAVQLNAAFQNYRLQMTGAAFGEKESAEYASILPSPGNTLALNRAKVGGALKYLESSIDSTLSSVVGKQAPIIRKLAEGQENDFEAYRDNVKPGEVLIMRNGEIGSVPPNEFNPETDIEL